MSIIIVLLLGVCISAYLIKTSKKFDTFHYDVMFFIFGLLLIFSCVCLGFGHLTAGGVNAEYDAFVETVEDYRKVGDTIERIAISQKIIEMNEDIANDRYWNDTFLDIYIPDVIIKHRNYIRMDNKTQGK